MEMQIINNEAQDKEAHHAAMLAIMIGDSDDDIMTDDEDAYYFSHDKSMSEEADVDEDDCTWLCFGCEKLLILNEESPSSMGYCTDCAFAANAANTNNTIIATATIVVDGSIMTCAHGASASSQQLLDCPSCQMRGTDQICFKHDDTSRALAQEQEVKGLSTSSFSAFNDTFNAANTTTTSTPAMVSLPGSDMGLHLPVSQLEWQQHWQRIMALQQHDLASGVA
jgi:hypothetical protein